MKQYVVPRKIRGVKGFEQVVHNLNRELMALEERSLAGLLHAIAFVRVDMDKTPPTIPVDLGNLRASWFVCTKKSTKTDEPVWDAGPDREGEFRDVAKLSSDHSSAIQFAKQAANSVKHSNVVAGFSANYAAPVHEMEDTKSVNWNQPGSGSWFFVSALNRNKDEIVKIVAENSKIKE